MANNKHFCLGLIITWGSSHNVSATMISIILFSKQTGKKNFHPFIFMQYVILIFCHSCQCLLAWYFFCVLFLVSWYFQKLAYHDSFFLFFAHAATFSVMFPLHLCKMHICLFYRKDWNCWYWLDIYFFLREKSSPALRIRLKMVARAHAAFNRQTMYPEIQDTIL